VAVIVTGRDLTPEEVVVVARSGEPVQLAPDALERTRLALVDYAALCTEL